MARTCDDCGRTTKDNKRTDCYYCHKKFPVCSELPPPARSSNLCIKIDVMSNELDNAEKRIKSLNPDYQTLLKSKHVTMISAKMSDDMAKVISCHLEELRDFCASYGPMLCVLNSPDRIVTSEGNNLIAYRGNERQNPMLRKLRDALWEKIFEFVGQPEISSIHESSKPEIVYSTPKGWLRVFEHDAWNCTFTPHVTLLRTKRQNIPPPILNEDQEFRIYLSEDEWAVEIIY